jgi:hypothetical protein
VSGPDSPGSGDYFMNLRRLDGTPVASDDDHDPYSGAGGSFYIDPFLDLDLAAGVYVLAISMLETVGTVDRTAKS